MSSLAWTNFYPALGRVFQVLLFGFLAAQIFRYHESFPNDRIALKAVAWTSFLLSLALTIMVLFEIALHVLILNPRQAIFDGMVSWDIRLDIWLICSITLLNGFVMAISQIFFSWRIRQISQKKWLQILICIFSMIQGAGSLANSMADSRLISVERLRISSSFPSVWIAGNIVCDLTITLSMLFFLRQARVAAVFKPTQTLLGKVLTFTLETGLITTIWMVVQLIAWQSSGDTQLYQTFFYPSGTLYAIWLLATLNARSSFNKDLPSFVDMTNLPTVPGNIRFKHPTIEGTEVVISLITNGVTSYGSSSEVESDSFRAHEPRGTGKHIEDVVE